MRKLVVAAVLLLAVSSGCAVQDRFNERRGRGDAPTGRVDDSAKEVIQFPDRFANVAHSCDGHGHRVFVTTRTDAGMQLSVIDDTSCGTSEPTG